VSDLKFGYCKAFAPEHACYVQIGIDPLGLDLHTIPFMPLSFYFIRLKYLLTETWAVGDPLGSHLCPADNNTLLNTTCLIVSSGFGGGGMSGNYVRSLHSLLSGSLDLAAPAT